MRKRPLCLAAILLLFAFWILPKGVWLQKPDIPSGETLTVEGTVYKRERKDEKQVYYLKDCISNQSNSTFSLLAYLPQGKSYPVGCRISIYGTVYQLNTANNPGQFDAEGYYQSQGILYTLQGESVLYSEGKSFLKENLTVLKEHLGESLMSVFNERDGGILKAVLLGDKSDLRDEDELLYQKNGISHLLAISGLHISMIGAGLYKFLRKLNLTFLEAGIPSGFLLFSYGMMTGFGISTIRAVCMFLVMILGEILGKSYDMASAMALAAIIVLLRNPLQARQAGFLLSFGAILGICMVYPILQSVCNSKKKSVQAALLSISLTLVTAPLSIHFFYEYPLYSMFINFIVIPFMPVVMLFGGAGMLAGLVWSPLGRAAGFPAHLILSFYEFLGNQIVKLPFSVIRFGEEELWQLILYYVILVLALLFLWYGKRRVYSLFIPMAVVIVLLRFHGNFEFTMLDVGQGDGLFLRFPDGVTCFIDGGSTNVKDVGAYRILPYLKHEGISRIDYVIFTHLDEDHISGTRELLEMTALGGVEIRNMLFPKIADPDDKYTEMWELGTKNGINVGKIGAGDQICGQEWQLVCLSPVKGEKSGDKNNQSTVLQMNYKKFSMLLTGDLGEEGEAGLLRRGTLEDIDVWKVSHHGSKYSGSEKFLQCIQPNVSLISVGRNNYGHPSKEILDRLHQAGSRVWSTLDCGAIFVESDGEEYWIRWQNEEMHLK